MRKIILSFAACLALAAYGQKPVQDTRAMDTFIDQLMGKMTLDEKIGQLNLSGGGVPGILSGSEGADETIRREHHHRTRRNAGPRRLECAVLVQK